MAETTTHRRTTEASSSSEDAGEEAGDTGVISVMPETLANKIAAGEVVQRPASVAKELMENALDAGASEVELVVKKAGRALVQVVDDGCGMGPEDARRCFQRHATSKLRAVEDLGRIQTLGFRGEALASIGAVAQVELKTKRPGDAAGLRVRVEGGETTETAPCAVPAGTSVAVRNLFYNVPARRSFLKTDATEFKHLVEAFQQQALAHPEVAFRLVHNGNEVYRLTKEGSSSERAFFAPLRRRIGELLGGDRTDGLRRVEDEASYLSVQGFVGAPAKSRRSRREQFLFVNGRYVENRYLAHAVKAAYGPLLSEGTFPFFALFLTLDPSRVDVNVHPTKAEVKFEDKSGIYGLLRSAVRDALSQDELEAPQFENDRLPGAERDAADAQDDNGGRPPRADFGGGASGESSGQSSASPSVRPRPPAAGASPSAGDLSEQLYAPPKERRDEEARRSSAEQTSEEAPPCWPLGKRFIAVRREKRLLVVDAPAAHRRVLYERTRRHFEEETNHPSQQLLFAETVELPAADVELFEELLPDLRRLGFDLNPFSGRTVAVKGLPAGARGDAEELLGEVLEEYRTLGAARGEARADRLAKSLARRGAVEADVQLSAREAQALVQALFRCEMPYADPNGEPTLIRFTPEALAERFEKD